MEQDLQQEVDTESWGYQFLHDLLQNSFVHGLNVKRPSPI